MSAEGTRRAIVAAFLANLGIAISKFFAFLITGSASMLAESIHSVADTGNQGLLFLGGKRAAQGTDRRAPVRLRHRALLLGVHRRARCSSPSVRCSPSTRASRSSSIPTSSSRRSGHSVCSVSRSCSRDCRCAPRTARRHRRAVDRSWWTFIRTTKSPELPVVLLEDSGALVGLLFALVGISLAEITGNARWDAMGSIGIGLLLGVIAVILAIEMKSLLIGEAVAPEVDATIRTAILGGPEISRIIHLRTSAPRPRRRRAGGEAGIHLRHHGRARRRDRHRRSTCASLGADRSAHLLRTRLLRPEPRGTTRRSR